MRNFLLILSLAFAFSAFALEKPSVTPPDLQKIKEETTNENSRYYYPKLLKMFMSNDTVMTNDDFQYFYYGTIFQEDYDPYRPSYHEDELKRIEPLYYKTGHTRQEKAEMQKYATEAIEDNPIDLEQLKNLIYVYEQNKKVNLAKIWKNKLNHLLLTIASSGTGTDPENAWFVAYPSHKFAFLNLSGKTVLSSDFEPPYYEKVSVNTRSDKDQGEYYFNIEPILEQYYLKHPSER